MIQKPALFFCIIFCLVVALSLVYGIIKKHGGGIDVESEPGKGTTFTITLPIEGVNNAKQINTAG